MRYPAPIFHPLQRGQKCSILGGQLVVVMFPAVQDPYITRNRSLGRIVESKAFFSWHTEVVPCMVVRQDLERHKSRVAHGPLH